MRAEYSGRHRALLLLWTTGLVAFPLATAVIIGPQAPLLAGIVLFGNLWMDVLALRPGRASRETPSQKVEGADQDDGYDEKEEGDVQSGEEGARRDVEP